MNVEKQVKRGLHWIVVLVVAVIIVALVLLKVTLFILNEKEIEKRDKFMSMYISEKAVVSLNRWCDYFEVDKWDIFNLLMTESNGKKFIVSSARCKGLLQLSDNTAKYCKERLYKLIRWKRYDIFNENINIATGVMFYKDILVNYAGGDELLAIELYNVGSYNYFHKKWKAPKHVTRYTLNKTFFEYEYKYFK